MKINLLFLLASWLLVCPQQGWARVQEEQPEAQSSPQSSGAPDKVDGEEVYVARDVDEKAVLTEKIGEPSYTKEAREKRIEGQVVLRVVLSAKGGVTHVRVIQGLEEGLTEQGVKVARQIKFKPAKKEGKPVSQWIKVVFNFNL